jgi:hypothetical protein
VTRTLAPAITGSDFRVISESNAARVAGQTVWQCTHFSQRLCPGNKEIQLPIPCMYERSAGVSISCIFSLGIMSPMSICSCTGPASHACPPLPTHIKKHNVTGTPLFPHLGSPFICDINFNANDQAGLL